MFRTSAGQIVDLTLRDPLDKEKKPLELKAEFTGKGSLSHVYKVTLPDGTVRAIKVLNMAGLDSYTMNAIEREVEILRRVDPEAHFVVVNLWNTEFAAIEMSFLEGKVLQNEERITPFQLTDCNFKQRANYIYQFYDQISKIHSPNKPVIIGDIHGGNVMIDFNHNTLRIFDFGTVQLAHSSSSKFIPVPKHMDKNVVGESPEAFITQKMGLVSDIYGSIAPMMLLLGAKNPGKFKEERLDKKSFENKFDPEGLLEGFELPNFMDIPLDRLVKHLLESMQAEKPEDRVQTVNELKEFWNIMQNMDAISVADAKDSDYMNAAKMIVIASGGGKIFLSSNDCNIPNCKDIVERYKADADQCIKELKNRYVHYPNEAKKFIEEVYPERNTFKASLEKCEKIALAKEENLVALTERFQLIGLIEYLAEQTSNKSKKASFEECRTECEKAYTDVNRTKELLKKICGIALKRETPGIVQSTTGDMLEAALKKGNCAALVHLISPGSKQVNSADLYTFIGQRSVLADLFSKISSIATSTFRLKH